MGRQIDELVEMPLARTAQARRKSQIIGGQTPPACPPSPSFAIPPLGTTRAEDHEWMAVVGAVREKTWRTLPGHAR